jgi:hypothetical protein
VPAALVSVDVEVEVSVDGLLVVPVPIVLELVPEPEVEGVAVDGVAVDGVAVDGVAVDGVLMVPEPLVVPLVEPAAGGVVVPGGAVVPGGVSVPGATVPVPVLPDVVPPVVPDCANTKPAAAARVSAARTTLLRGVLIWKSPVAER